MLLYEHISMAISTILSILHPKGYRPPQVVDNFRLAMASIYKLAQANKAYSRFSFFFNPRYTVFL